MALQAFVEVLVDGVYNDPEHRAQSAQAGQYITVAGGWYVESLVESGLVMQVGEREYREGAREQWFQGKNMEGVSGHLSAALAAAGSHKPIQDLQSIVQMANDLHDLDAALALAGEHKEEPESEGPDWRVIAQDQALVEPDLNPQPVDEAFLAEMTRIAEANGEYDRPQPPSVADKNTAPPGRVPEKAVVKADQPQPRRLVPENQGRRRRG